MLMNERMYGKRSVFRGTQQDDLNHRSVWRSDILHFMNRSCGVL